MTYFLPQEKKQLISSYLAGNKIAKICRNAGVSRKTFYVWLKKYQSVKPNLSHLVLSDRRFKKKMEYKKLNTTVKKEFIDKVLNQKISITQVCKDMHISRKTFYKWLQRFREKGDVGLNDLYVKGSRHPRGLSLETKQKVLDYVALNPKQSVHQITQNLNFVSHHGIQNILEDYNLNTIADRLIYASKFAPQITDVKPTTNIDTVSLPALDELSPNVLPGPPPPLPAKALTTADVASGFSAVSSTKASSSSRLSKIVKYTFITGLFSVILSFCLWSFWGGLLGAKSLSQAIGTISVIMSLMIGGLFFLYSLKYYFSIAFILLFSRKNLNREKGTIDAASAIDSGLLPDVSHIQLSRHPFVSIHLPLYNEKRVVNRLLEAVTSIDYPRLDAEVKPIPNSQNYEVIVCDDSTDETKDIINEWHNHPLIKISHRDNRNGFKGGALQLALKAMAPETEFILVFDADFLPYPDTIVQFLKYFQAVAPKSNLNHLGSLGNIAAVQGYQWHVLNKSENWITRSVRTEYAGSYVVERSGTEIYKGLKQIAGSVYMIRSDILKKYNWGTSITEDFELTLKLYRDGYKVVYTPYIQAPSECVSTLKRLIKQRMRWAEGHSHNIKKHFIEMMWGRFVNRRGEGDSNETIRPSDNQSIKFWIPSRLTLTEKFEFLYLSPYYLQSFFFLVGTFFWFISETIFRVQLPFWTAVWGWSLVLTNMLSLPLMNTVGLFLEEAEEKDYAGVASFVLLSYILAPFQAYAAIRGFIEQAEGPWFRTPKTGRITDVFKKGSFYRWLFGILAKPVSTDFSLSRLNYLTQPLGFFQIQSQKNSFFSQFHYRKLISRVVLAVLLIFSSTITYLTPFIPIQNIKPAQAQVKISNPNSPASNQEKQKNNTTNQEPSLIVEENNPELHPQDFYLDLDQMVNLEADKDGDNFFSEIKDLDNVKQNLKRKMVSKIKRLKPEIEHSNNQEGDFLPYYFRQTDEGYQLFIKSKNGIQRYQFDKNSISIRLAEKTTDNPKFIDKAISIPIFQYQDMSGEWHDYTEPTAINYNLQEFESYLNLKVSFNLSASDMTTVQVTGGVELKLGFDGEKYISKLTFKLGGNENKNRLIWQTELLEAEAVKEDKSFTSDQPIFDNVTKKQIFNDVVVNWADFSGETHYQQIKETSSARVYFYEDGIKGSFEVDPTVSLSWPSSVLTVTSNTTPSWKLAFQATDLGTGINYMPEIFTPSSDTTPSGFMNIGNFLSDINYWSYNDTGGSAQVIESSPTRTVVRSIGTMDSGGEAGTNGAYTIDWVITPYGFTGYVQISNVVSTADEVHLSYWIWIASEMSTTRHIYDDDTVPADDNFSGTTWFVALPAGITYPKIGSVAYNGTTAISTNIMNISGLGTFDKQVRADFSGITGVYAEAFGDDDITGDGLTSGDSWIIRVNVTGSDADGTLARAMARDHWNPDDLSDNIGAGTSGWFDTDESTASTSDFFNDTEGTYSLIGTMGEGSFATYDIDGGTYSRYKPHFKFRGWRSTAEPTEVTLEGVTQTDSTNYNLDIAPFSEAWAYDSGGTWKKLADAGDTADTDEYLNDSSDNFDFDQAGYDIFDNSADYFYLGSHDQFTGVNLNLGTVGTGNAALVWQYCSANSDINTACDTWSTLSVSDTDSGASNMTASGNFYFTNPAWIKATVNSGRTLYWIRAYINSGSYTDFPVETTIRTDILLLQYLGDISTNDQTFVIVPENLWPLFLGLPAGLFLYNRRKRQRKNYGIEN